MVQRVSVLFILESSWPVASWVDCEEADAALEAPADSTRLEELPDDASCPARPPTPLALEGEDLTDSLPVAAARGRCFTKEALHKTPIHDLLAPHHESRALDRAQKVIEEQKERIESLTEAVLRYQQSRGDSHQRLQSELQEYIKENQRLRLQLDSLRAEVSALEQVRSRDEREVQEVVEALSAAERGIAERDKLIKVLQSQDKRAENERLKEEQQRLLLRIDKLQKLTGVFGDAELDSRSPADIADQLARVQRDVELHRGMTRQLGHTTEVRFAGVRPRCVRTFSGLCSNLLEGQKLIEEQRAEIQRLYKIIEALNREKALVPPVVLTLPKHLRGAGVEQLEALSTKMGLILQALDRARQEAGADDREERVSMAMMHQKMLEEQQALLKSPARPFACRLLEGFNRLSERGPDRGETWRGDGNFFYTGTAVHACTESLDQDADYREKIMAVKEGMLCVFYDPKASDIFVYFHFDICLGIKCKKKNKMPALFGLSQCFSAKRRDEDPIAILRPHKAVKVEMDPASLLITIGYEPCPGRTETHFFRVATEDEMNRWHYALAYAGFIRPAPPTRQPPPSASPSIPQSSEPPSTHREEMVVSVSVPGCLGFDGEATEPQRHDARIQYVKSKNALSITSPSDIVPFIIPCSDVEMSINRDSNSIVFTSPQASELACMHSANLTALAARCRLIETVSQGKYYVPKKEPTPPTSEEEEKPKTPPPAPEPAKITDDNDLFVIKDGWLMLFEKAGDTQPMLKLHNTDCATQPDAASREFVITHKPGTPEEETYVFTFPTDEVFQRWYKKFEENGFLKRKVEQASRTSNQVGVVSKGCLELYKDYGSPDAKPVIVLMANRCSAKASRERREIRILHTNPQGKRERITLDCASLPEFDRWDVALHFGNFLTGDGATGTNWQTYTNLTKYVFPINLFEDASGRKSALIIEDRTIKLFATPDATEPVLSAVADDCEVQPVISQRKLRVYINRNTKKEQRIDFILHLAKDFDRYVAACQRNAFPEAIVGKAVEKLSIPFVLCRKGLMAVYKSKFHAHAELTFEVPKYTFEEDGPVFLFISNEGENKEVRVALQSCRWEFALKVAGFKSFSKSPPPRFFFPQIIYGFVAEEAAELRKDSFLGSARAALGRLQMSRAIPDSDGGSH
ncbi:hypothetical protein Efla_002185 [Eimeria flavescens]